jgi:hypothetical protein
MKGQSMRTETVSVAMAAEDWRNGIVSILGPKAIQGRGPQSEWSFAIPNVNVLPPVVSSFDDALHLLLVRTEGEAEHVGDDFFPELLPLELADQVEKDAVGDL